MKRTARFRLLRPLALCLCLCLALSACAFPFDWPFDFPFGFFGEKGKAEAEPPPERRTIPYADMAYERPDVEAVLARLGELTASLAEAPSFEAVMALDEEAGAAQEAFDSMNALAMLKKYHDVNDTYWEEEYRFLEEASVEVDLAVSKFNKALMEGPYAGDYRAEVGDFVYAAMENQLLLHADAVAAYKKQRNDLAVDYNNLLAGLTYTYEGTEYTLDDVFAADSPTLLYALWEGLYNANAEQFADIYAQMVQLDKQTAETLGFESPAAMYYLSYGRDYSPAQSQALLDEVKNSMVSLVLPLLLSGFEPGGAPQAETLSRMPAALESIDPELAEAWAFMQQYGLHDLDSASGKQSGIAFATEIGRYDAPFIFMNWDEADFLSTTTIMHEFGHFYDFWLRYSEVTASGLDLAEVYSQALELLMHQSYGTFTENAEDAALNNLSDMAVSGVVYQAALEEFQLRVYELDSFDANILGRLWSEVQNDYGLGVTVLTDANGADNTWFRVTHLFDTPFYTVSYVTSALAALQLWSAGRDNWAAAANAYVELIHANQNQPFDDLMESAGLRSVHSPAVMRAIAEDLREVFAFDENAQSLPFAA